MSRSKNIFVIIVLLLINSIIGAQVVDSEKTINKINNKVIHFLINQAQLEKGQLFEKYLEQISIVEVFKKEPLGCCENGIFSFRALFSPNITYIMLKIKSEVKILDPYYFSKTIKEVLDFLDKQKIPNKDKVVYIEEVIKVYEMNRYDSKYRM
jgi:hypothetical protein